MLKWLALGAICLGMPCMAAGQKPQPVPSLDAGRFLGIWFEIARLPNGAEKKCAGDALMMFAPEYKPGSFQIVDSCKRPDGTHNVRNQSGKRADKIGDGKLKVQTFWPFSTKVWVVGVAPDYGWALLATPNRKKLWVLSRTATLPSDRLTAAEAMASVQGFNTGKLMAVSQTP